MKEDKFIEDRKAEFTSEKVEYACLNMFRTQRFLKPEIRRSGKIEYAAFTEFLRRMG